MSYILHNGEFIDRRKRGVYVDNRGFHFGDGFFESIRVINGNICFLENHFARIVDSMEALKMAPPEDFSFEAFRDEIKSLLKKNKINQGGRIRITFTRKATGYYLPQGNEVEYIIEAIPFENNHFVLNPSGKTMDIFPDIKKDINALSMFKTLNCSLYIMASLYAKEQGLDDAFIQNSTGSIIESTSTNIFVVSNGVLYTPDLKDGCVAGTMRMQIINIALDNSIKVYECTITPQNLLAADEIFLTNAIHGIQWVSSYRTKRYFNEMGHRMVDLLNEHMSALA